MWWLLVFLDWTPTKWHLMHPAFPSFNNLPVAHCPGWSHVTGSKTTRIIILFLIFPMALRFEIEIVNPIIKISLISSKKGFESGSRFWWGSKQTETRQYNSSTELLISFGKFPTWTSIASQPLITVPNGCQPSQWHIQARLNGFSCDFCGASAYRCPQFSQITIFSSAKHFLILNCYINPPGKSAWLRADVF